MINQQRHVICYIVCLFGLMLTFFVQADSERTTQYSYDAVGNLISIRSGDNLDPPTITGLIPDKIRIGPQQILQAMGSNLFNVKISSDNSDLNLEVIDFAEGILRFHATANEDSELGMHTLTFTTSLGSASAELTVNPKRPKIVIAPVPLLFTPASASRAITVYLDKLDVEDHTLKISTLHSNIATVTPPVVTIPLGQTLALADLIITPHDIGFTRLRIHSASLAETFVQIIVTEPYVVPAGTHHAYGHDLGVLVGTPDQPVFVPFERAINSPLVGVRKGSHSVNPTTQNIELYSRHIGLFKNVK